MSLNLSLSWWVFALTVSSTVLFCLALTPLARKIKLVDHPGKRKVHQTATPLTGGLAVFLVLTVVATWFLPMNTFIQALGLGGLIMVITGMADDRSHLSATVRFLVQIAVCLLMVIWADVRIDDFGRLMWNGVFSLGWLSIPVTLFAAIGVINAFNMIDGMDGLAGGIFLISASGMSIFALIGGQGDVLQILLLMMTSVVGFLIVNGRLPWNSKARVFLGNAGSLLLGFFLAWLFIKLGSGEERVFAPMTAVWLFAVPLLDTTTLIWRRLRSGQSAFQADQYHIHHAFLRAGFSVSATWWSIILMAALFGGVGLLFEIGNVPEYVGFYVFLGLGLVYYFYISRSWQMQRFLGRDFVYGEFDVEAGVT